MAVAESIVSGQLPRLHEIRDGPSKILHVDVSVVARRVLRLPEGTTRVPFRNQLAVISRLRKTYCGRGANR